MGGNLDTVIAVPAVDSAGNTTFADVIGNKSDTHMGGSSIFSKTDTINDHLHNISRVYPVLAAPVTLAKAAGAWAAFPLSTELVPAATIASVFDIHYVFIGAISANGDYVLELYTGAGAGTLCAQICFTRSANFRQEMGVYCMTPLIAANTRISAAISSSNAAADTCTVKIMYHTY